ncbi:MAG: hypothetical protein Ta2F_06900 [Termitinemataceae bacterium]|nr:MAG: hypothetical protein Ta2F_06900 [Termitinemataceae bacterium]
MKKLFFLFAAVFFSTVVETYAQTINFEYDVSQKYPIYFVFEGDISAAWESTAWFSDESSWHYNSSEWKVDPKTEMFYYAGPDQDNDDHWIIDQGVDFYIGPDDPNNSYAYLNNSKKDWEMFRMALNNKNTIYATGNVIFDRIGGTPSAKNPYIGQWRAREDSSLVVTFNANNSCKLEVTSAFKTTPLVGSPAPAPKKPATSGSTTPPSSLSPVKTAQTAVAPSATNGIAAGGNSVRDKLIAEIKTHLGARYKTGQTGTTQYDCSGLVQSTYKAVTGLVLPRTSVEMYRQGPRIKAGELKPGDIIVYDTQNRGGPTHVGMFIGDNKFIHAWGPGGDAKVVEHSRDKKSYGKPMSNMEIGYLRFLND